MSREKHTEKGKIILFKPAESLAEIRKRKLKKLNNATNIINLSFEKILEIKLNKLN
ncbi:MAG: hypothetical protein AB1571_04130 [Nanoarchaeota archaeon]